MLLDKTFWFAQVPINQTVVPQEFWGKRQLYYSRPDPSSLRKGSGLARLAKTYIVNARNIFVLNTFLIKYTREL